MFGGDCTARILLDPNKKQYYVTGDVVSGVIDLHTSGMYSITDVQVKLRCDEYSVATYYTESDRRQAKRQRNAQRTGLIAPLRRAAQQQALKQLGKAGNFDEDTMQIVGDGLKMLRERKKHYQLTTNAFSTASGEEKTMLSQGHHSYPFSFRLSDAINKCPPHAPVSTSHGMKIGVFWTVKAVVRRPGRFQADIREVIRVPVYPENPHREHIDFHKMKKVSDTGSNGLTTTVTYPEAGLAQDGHPIPLSIEATADGKYDVQAIKLGLTQTCISKAKGFKETNTDEIELATGRGLRLSYETADLMPYLGSIRLERLIAPTLSLANIKITYELTLSIAASNNPIVLRHPITVLSPADTAPPPFMPKDTLSSVAPPMYSHPSSSASSSSHTPSGDTYTIQDKSLYPTIGSTSTASMHSQSSDSISRGDAEWHKSNTHTEVPNRDYKPPLPPRVPLDTPPYSRRPSTATSDSARNSGSTSESLEAPPFPRRPSQARSTYTRNSDPIIEPAAGIQLMGSDNTTGPLPNQYSDGGETWYPGLQSTSHGPNSSYLVDPNRSAQTTGGDAATVVSQMESIPTGSTDSTLVEPAETLASLQIEEEYENEQAPHSTGGLPTYDDVIRSRGPAQP